MPQRCNMKFTNRILLIICFTATFFTQSCKKNSEADIFVATQSIADTTWSLDSSLPSNINQSIKSIAVIDSFDCTNDSKIKVNDQVEVNFGEKGCMSSLSPSSTITTRVHIKAEIQAITSKGDLLRNGIIQYANGMLFDAGYIINIKLSNKGKEVYWNSNIPIFITIKNHPVKSGMQFYTMQKNGIDTNGIWVNNSSLGAISTSTTTGNTIITSNTIGWFGCFKTIPISSQLKTRVNVSLPLNFTNRNTAVFAIFDSFKTVQRLLPYSSGKTYFAPNIPINSALKIVSISYINNNYFIGVQSLVTTAQTSSTLLKIVPTQYSAPDLVQFLNNL